MIDLENAELGVFFRATGKYGSGENLSTGTLPVAAMIKDICQQDGKKIEDITVFDLLMMGVDLVNATEQIISRNPMIEEVTEIIGFYPTRMEAIEARSKYIENINGETK